jgi:WD40 repeat protein
MTQATRCVAAHEVDGVAFSPDGKSVAITSSGFSSAVQLFDIDSGAARWKNSRLRASSEVSFSADGSLLCVGGWKAAILDAGDGHVVMWGPDSPWDDVVRTSISPGGTRLITVREREVRVFDVRSGAETRRFHLSSKHCHCVRYSPGGTLATLGEEGIQVWDAVFGELLARLQVPANTNQMQFGGCSHVLVTAARSDSVIRVWDVTSGTLTGLCDTGPSNRWLTLGDGSGRVALTRGADRTLRVWDVTRGQERTRLPPRMFGIGGVVNSDATKLAIEGGKSVEIWSLAGGPGQPPAPDAAAPVGWCRRCSAG